MLRILAFLIVAILISACEVFDRPEEIPSYLEITDISLSTDAGVEGENTERITDAWVYMDNQLLGIFELPARIPILAEGSHDFEIRAGIHNNGVSELRRAYPFYEPILTTLTLHRDSIVIIKPGTIYRPNLQFDPNPEDFESAGQTLIKNVASDTGWVIETNGPTGKYGKIVLDDGKNYAYFHTDDNHNFPKLGAKVYLEMDVKTNNHIRLGVIDEGSTSIKRYNNYGIRPTTQSGFAEWKKIYIELTDVLSYESQETQHEFFFEVLKDDGVSTVEVCIDNLKIVYF